MRVYPSTDNDKQELYTLMLDRSKQLFNQYTSGLYSRYPQTNGFVRADPRNMSKTNPLPPKEKAVDLKDHYPLLGSLNKVIEKKSKILTRLIGVNDQDQEQYLRIGKAQSSLTHEDERNRYADQRFI